MRSSGNHSEFSYSGGDRSCNHEPDVILNLLTRKSEVLSLAPEWNKLLDNSDQNHVFLTWEWVSTWLSCFADTCSLQIVTARAGNGGSLLGVAPLAIYVHRVSRVIKLRELSFVGSELAPDHMDFLICV